MIAMRPILLSAAFAFAWLLAASAEAQLTNDEVRCIDTYNNKLRLVSQQKGKDITTCIKDFIHDKLPPGQTQDACVAKVAPGTKGAIEKVTKLYETDTCTGSEPIQMGVYAGTTAHVGGMIALTHDLLGTPISTVPGSTEAKCKENVVKRTVQTFIEQVRVFRNCCRDKMRAGIVTDSVSLQASDCLPTASDTIDSKSAGKVLDALQARCAGIARASIFAGLANGCSSSVSSTQDCIVHRIDCRVCQTLNTADGTARDCDLFDDGLANLSCTP